MAYVGPTHVRDIVQAVRGCSLNTVYFVASTYEKGERKEKTRQKLVFLEI